LENTKLWQALPFEICLSWSGESHTDLEMCQCWQHAVAWGRNVHEEGECSANGRASEEAGHCFSRQTQLLEFAVTGSPWGRWLLWDGKVLISNRCDVAKNDSMKTSLEEIWRLGDFSPLGKGTYQYTVVCRFYYWHHYLAIDQHTSHPKASIKPTAKYAA
jgi:hypothetical protein